MAATCSALSSLGDIMLVVREEEEETREGGAVELLAAELTAVHAALRDDYLADVPPARLDEQAKAWSGHARELACDAALLARRADGSLTRRRRRRSRRFSRGPPTCPGGGLAQPRPSTLAGLPLPSTLARRRRRSSAWTPPRTT